MTYGRAQINQIHVFSVSLHWDGNTKIKPAQVSRAALDQNIFDILKSMRFVIFHRSTILQQFVTLANLLQFQTDIDTDRHAQWIIR